MDSTLFFSKSKYCEFWQCPKAAWLRMHKPETAAESADAQMRMQTGNEIGALARELFGSYTDVTAQDGDRLDLPRMIAATRKEMKKQTPVICEAAFSYNGLYCAVDILKREGAGWAIYEVKSSTDAQNPVYLADVAYQTFVLERCGVAMTGVYLVCLNSRYVYDGNLDLKQLFQINDLTVEAREEIGAVEERLAEARRMLASGEEPEIDLSERCGNPNQCAFWQYCTRLVGTPSVFDLHHMAFKKKLRLYHDGYVSYESLQRGDIQLSEKHRRQISHALYEQKAYTEPERIKVFLKKLSYPLYFLDFETIQPAIPKYIGTKPYSQIPFQYSLHYIEREGGELKHLEFLGVPEEDPRRALAERLCEDIPMGACVTAYNKAFECTRIKELAEVFPDLAAHLLDIREHIVDLLTPFQSGWYYNRAMGGSFSIKSVLPALFSDDPTLDYHNLEEIHHGGEAMAAFPSMLHMSPEERERTRRNLFKYCELDTFAMVKVWEKLQEAAVAE